MMPELVSVMKSERLNASVALSVTFPVPSAPVVPPLPTCQVPALTVFWPECVMFVPVHVQVPVPVLMKPTLL